MMLIGQVWRRFKHYVRDIRIDADFGRYELEQRAGHQLIADRRFDPTPLNREIEAILRAAEVEAFTMYGARICELESAVGQVQSNIQECRRVLDVLTRDYRDELEQLHREKGRLLDEKRFVYERNGPMKQEHAAIRAKLRDAFKDLNAAKESIRRWHDKSKRTPWLLGNGGKKLPSRSPFGQSMGDLNGYKADRERASNAIGYLKAELAAVEERQRANWSRIKAIEAALDLVFQSITAVKDAQRVMFDLENRGFARHRVEADLTELHREQGPLKVELNRLAGSKAELVELHAARSGIYERRQALAGLEQTRTDFLASFDRPERRSERQQAHRESWLKARELA